jgi:hypothetical protein
VPSSIRCQSCQRPVPDDPSNYGVVDLAHAPPEVARHWPTSPGCRPGATFCVSCLLRATLRLFGPGARRDPLAQGT